ncbi:hypothetical protein AB5I41_27660 [Sphingomonas sp. MMS24-JH45]
MTGLRGGLASAAQIKRNSDGIRHAVVAQDIGKLPDDSAAETLARIPGAGPTARPIRSRASWFAVSPTSPRPTTAALTADLRRAQYEDLPAQALAGLEVYR